MRRKILALLGFVSLAPLTLIFSTSLLLGSRHTPSIASPQVLGASATTPLFSTSTDTSIQSVSGEPLLADARPIIIKNYLSKWQSPLVPYANLIVSLSDNNGVDPFLVIAIAQQESNLGRRVIANCFNAWGWAQTSTYTRCFSSWDQGIRDYIQEFSQNYIKIGLTTPEEIMSKYNPTSPEGAWANGVSQFLQDLENTAS